MGLAVSDDAVTRHLLHALGNQATFFFFAVTKVVVELDYIVEVGERSFRQRRSHYVVLGC